MHGVLLVDKPAGWTSFDVVNFVRRQVAAAEGARPKSIKVGHTGTLDPLATGLLVLLVGKDYTRRAPELTKLDKVYEVTMRLGITSTTGDEEGDKTPVSTRRPTPPELTAALKQFTGELLQTPPVFSAIKINGQRAYELARRGQPPTLAARPVHIFDATLTDYTYPLVRFTSHVSSGTYIRSLVTDLGTTLATGAYMTALRRTTVGQFRLDDAITIARDEPDISRRIVEHLRLL